MFKCLSNLQYIPKKESMLAACIFKNKDRINSVYVWEWLVSVFRNGNRIRNEDRVESRFCPRSPNIYLLLVSCI